MTSLAEEREHLVLANRHLVEGELRIIRQMELIEELREAGYATGVAEVLLETMRVTLEAWNGHRDAILAVIERLEKQGNDGSS